ncbi:MAG: amidohydrolase family protein [Acidobacteria bacterium]|nr:amidohydrolase family protein [Acidobacteriota bacterium]
MTRKAYLTLLASLFLAACQPTSTPESQDSTLVVITGATVIDGVSSTPIENAVIVIEGDTIQAIGSAGSVEVPPGAQRVDASGKTIIPGIFNLHAHVARSEGMESDDQFYNRERIQRDANRYLYYGITHMVSLGIDQEPMIGFLEDQRAGRTGGARLYSAGYGFAAKDGWIPGNPNLNRPTTPDEARQLVQELVQERQPDVIKIWVDDRLGELPKLTPELYGAIIEEAHSQGIKVMAHMYYLEDTKELIRRGVDGLAHSVRDQEVDDEFLRLAKENGVTQVATLVGHSSRLAYADGPDFLDDPALPVLFPPLVLETVSGQEYQANLANSPNLASTREVYATAAKNLAKVAAAGIPIAVGTDSGGPGRFQGLWEHREMELMVKAGLTPMQAIQAATANGAKFLGLEDQYGTLEPGKIADLIILNADPLEDIRNTRNIDEVWMNGERVNRADLPISTAPPTAQERETS